MFLTLTKFKRIYNKSYAYFTRNTVFSQFHEFALQTCLLLILQNETKYISMLILYRMIWEMKYLKNIYTLGLSMDTPGTARQVLPLEDFPETSCILYRPTFPYMCVYVVNNETFTLLG